MGRRRVKVGEEENALTIYNGNDNDNDNDNKVLLGEDTSYNRERELKKFQEDAKKKRLTKLKIPTAQDLYYKREDLKKSREELYEKILHHVILNINNANKNEEIECQYTIPMEMARFPTYDFTECVWYIVSKLRSEGNMFIRFWEPNVLYVNWRVKMNKKPNAKTKPKQKTTSDKPKTKGRGKSKKELNVGTFNLDSDDDLLSSLAGL